MYTIAEFKDAQAAEKLSKRINSIGIQSYVRKADRNGKNKKFRLRVFEEDKDLLMKAFFKS